MARVEQKTQAFNTSGQAPYTISMAIGISQFDIERDSVEEFLANLDRQMYAAKNTYYRTQGCDRRRK